MTDHCEELQLFNDDSCYLMSTGTFSVLKSTPGKINYCRLCRLLISIGSRVLRDTFDRIIPPENLRELLKRDPAHSRQNLRELLKRDPAHSRQNLGEFLKRDPAHNRLKLLRKEGVPSNKTSVHWGKLYIATPTEASSASLELNYQKPYPKKKRENRHRLFTSSIKGEVEYLGSVHPYLDIFESETFSFRVRLSSTRIR